MLADTYLQRNDTWYQLNVLDSIVVSIPACHAGDPGSIPGREDLKHTARLAQSVERWPFKPVVVGSSPTVGAAMHLCLEVFFANNNSFF